MVIDFEYAGPNVPAFDISNHFCEWMHNYNHPTEAYAVTIADYPSLEAQLNLLYSYVLFPSRHRSGKRDGQQLPLTDEETKRLEAETKLLFNEVIYWRPAVNILWALWAILQNGPMKAPEEQDKEILETGPNGEKYKIIITSKCGDGQTGSEGSCTEEEEEEEEELEEELVGSEEQNQGSSDVDNFQYLKFARDKLECYWGDLLQLGIVKENEIKDLSRLKLLNVAFFEEGE